jgi:hypothetical protein
MAAILFLGPHERSRDSESRSQTWGCSGLVREPRGGGGLANELWRCAGLR